MAENRFRPQMSFETGNVVTIQSLAPIMHLWVAEFFSSISYRSQVIGPFHFDLISYAKGLQFRVF